MENEKLEIILNSILEEQAKITRGLNELKKANEAIENGIKNQNKQPDKKAEYFQVIPLVNEALEKMVKLSTVQVQRADHFLDQTKNSIKEQASSIEKMNQKFQQQKPISTFWGYFFLSLTGLSIYLALWLGYEVFSTSKLNKELLYQLKTIHYLYPDEYKSSIKQYEKNPDKVKKFLDSLELEKAIK